MVTTLFQMSLNLSQSKFLLIYIHTPVQLQCQPVGKGSIHHRTFCCTLHDKNIPGF